jgi:hypothetical protein
MKILFHIVFILTLINISVQFFYNSNTQINKTTYPTGNPIVRICAEKIYKRTLIERCFENVDNYYNSKWNSTTHKSDQKDCCLFWGNTKCIKKYMPNVCTPHEEEEFETYLREIIKIYGSGICKQWPFESDKCYYY